MTLFDNVGIDLKDITVTINYSSGVEVINNVTALSTAFSRALSNAQSTAKLSKNHTLEINISDLNLNDDDEVKIEISATDVNGLNSKATHILAQSSSLDLFGPNGESSPIVTVPNPFDPTKESMFFWYQSKSPAQLNISIYSLNLELVKTMSRSITAGPTDKLDIWDGRDMSGNIVPNGVYIYILKTEKGSKTQYKRGKIAVPSVAVKVCLV